MHQSSYISSVVVPRRAADEQLVELVADVETAARRPQSSGSTAVRFRHDGTSAGNGHSITPTANSVAAGHIDLA
uniref:Uncharacterized protein n=1 Tax=Oryza punctata TaxID=4537 RepID=A0A0E0JXM7_ORYPU